MTILTSYGEFNLEKTTTSIMATHENGIQYFIDKIQLPNPNHTSDINRIINLVEEEYEFQHDIQN